jgi:hypothetical protein
MFGTLDFLNKKTLFVGPSYQINGQLGKKMVIFLGFLRGEEFSDSRKCTNVSNLYKKSRLSNMILHSIPLQFSLIFLTVCCLPLCMCAKLHRVTAKTIM